MNEMDLPEEKWNRAYRFWYFYNISAQFPSWVIHIREFINFMQTAPITLSWLITLNRNNNEIVRSFQLFSMYFVFASFAPVETSIIILFVFSLIFILFFLPGFMYELLILDPIFSFILHILLDILLPILFLLSAGVTTTAIRRYRRNAIEMMDLILICFSLIVFFVILTLKVYHQANLITIPKNNFAPWNMWNWYFRVIFPAFINFFTVVDDPDLMCNAILAFCIAYGITRLVLDFGTSFIQPIVQILVYSYNIYIVLCGVLHLIMYHIEAFHETIFFVIVIVLIIPILYISTKKNNILCKKYLKMMNLNENELIKNNKKLSISSFFDSNTLNRKNSHYHSNSHSYGIDTNNSKSFIDTDVNNLLDNSFIPLDENNSIKKNKDNNSTNSLGLNDENLSLLNSENMRNPNIDDINNSNNLITDYNNSNKNKVMEAKSVPDLVSLFLNKTNFKPNRMKAANSTDYLYLSENENNHKQINHENQNSNLITGDDNQNNNNDNNSNNNNNNDDENIIKLNEKKSDVYDFPFSLVNKKISIGILRRISFSSSKIASAFAKFLIENTTNAAIYAEAMRFIILLHSFESDESLLEEILTVDSGRFPFLLSQMICDAKLYLNSLRVFSLDYYNEKLDGLSSSIKRNLIDLTEEIQMDNKTKAYRCLEEYTKHCHKYEKEALKLMMQTPNSPNLAKCLSSYYIQLRGDYLQGESWQQRAENLEVSTVRFSLAGFKSRMSTLKPIDSSSMQNKLKSQEAIEKVHPKSINNSLIVFLFLTVIYFILMIFKYKSKYTEIGFGGYSKMIFQSISETLTIPILTIANCSADIIKDTNISVPLDNKDNSFLNEAIQNITVLISYIEGGNKAKDDELINKITYLWSTPFIILDNHNIVSSNSNISLQYLLYQMILFTSFDSSEGYNMDSGGKKIFSVEFMYIFFYILEQSMNPLHDIRASIFYFSQKAIDDTRNNTIIYLSVSFALVFVFSVLILIFLLYFAERDKDKFWLICLEIEDKSISTLQTALSANPILNDYEMNNADLNNNNDNSNNNSNDVIINNDNNNANTNSNNKNNNNMNENDDNNMNEAAQDISPRNSNGVNNDDNNNNNNIKKKSQRNSYNLNSNINNISNTESSNNNDSNLINENRSKKASAFNTNVINYDAANNNSKVTQLNPGLIHNPNTRISTFSSSFGTNHSHQLPSPRGNNANAFSSTVQQRPNAGTSQFNINSAPGGNINMSIDAEDQNNILSPDEIELNDIDPIYIPNSNLTSNANGSSEGNNMGNKKVSDFRITSVSSNLALYNENTNNEFILNNNNNNNYDNNNDYYINNKEMSKRMKKKRKCLPPIFKFLVFSIVFILITVICILLYVYFIFKYMNEGLISINTSDLVSSYINNATFAATCCLLINENTNIFGFDKAELEIFGLYDFKNFSKSLIDHINSFPQLISAGRNILHNEFTDNILSVMTEMIHKQSILINKWFDSNYEDSSLLDQIVDIAFHQITPYGTSIADWKDSHYSVLYSNMRIVSNIYSFILVLNYLFYAICFIMAVHSISCQFDSMKSILLLLPSPYFATISNLISLFYSEKSGRRGGKDKSSKVQSRFIVKQSLDTVIVLNHRQRIQDVNKATEDLVGYKREELIGSNITKIILKHDENNNNNNINNNDPNYVNENNILLNNGENISSNNLNNNNVDGGFFSQITFFTMQSNAAPRFNLQVIRKDGLLTPVNCTLIPIHGDDNNNNNNNNNISNWASVNGTNRNLEQEDAPAFAIVLCDRTLFTEHEQLLQESKKSVESLLYRILPRVMAKKLLSPNQKLHSKVERATIIFIGIANFPTWCKSHTHFEIMERLDIIVSMFDQNISKFPTLVKLKVINGVYMAAGGLFSEVSKKSIPLESVEFAILCSKSIEQRNKMNLSSSPLLIGGANRKSDNESGNIPISDNDKENNVNHNVNDKDVIYNDDINDNDVIDDNNGNGNVDNTVNNAQEETLTMRLTIGINTGGPIIAGILGSDKPLFDVWGDAVNVSSRLQYSCPENHIQMSKETMMELPENMFEIEERKGVFLKGKGYTNTYTINLDKLNEKKEG